MADSITDMTTLVRDNLDEAVAGYWTDAEIQRKIVRRYRELWSRIIAIRDDWFKSAVPATVTLVAGTLKYALPADFFRTATIRTTTSTPKRQITTTIIPMRRRPQTRRSTATTSCWDWR